MATFNFEFDAEEVFNALTDPDLLVDRGLALGDIEAECSVEADGRKTTVVLVRRVKRDLPKFIAKIFGDENTLKITEVWEQVGANYMGTINADVEGQPVEVSAKFSMKPTETGCSYTADYKCKAKIPLVGRKVEDFVLSQTESTMMEEMKFTAQALAEATA